MFDRSCIRIIRPTVPAASIWTFVAEEKKIRQLSSETESEKSTLSWFVWLSLETSLKWGLRSGRAPYLEYVTSLSPKFVQLHHRISYLYCHRVVFCPSQTIYVKPISYCFGYKSIKNVILPLFPTLLPL